MPISAGLASKLCNLVLRKVYPCRSLENSNGLITIDLSGRSTLRAHFSLPTSIPTAKRQVVEMAFKGLELVVFIFLNLTYAKNSRIELTLRDTQPASACVNLCRMASRSKAL